MEGTAIAQKLTTLRLAAATYFLVAGGPYGLEELVQSDGYGRAAAIVVVTPLVFSLPTALMVGELSSAIPEDGGYYLWVKRALGPFGGFVEAWLSLCASFFDMAIYPTLFVTYLARAVPGADVGAPRILLGLAMIAACTLWNLRGARSVGNASLVGSVVLLSPFVVLAAIASVTSSHAASPEPAQTSVGAGILVAMWNFMGWDNASTFAGEVDRPQRTYPRAMLIAVCAVIVTYLVPILAAARTGIAPSEWSTGAWVHVAERMGGPWLGRAVIAGGIVCGIGMYNALLLSYSRVPAALAEDGLLPKVFARTNDRAVPIVSVVVCSVFYSLGLFLSFRKLVEIDLLFYGVALLLEFVALVVLRVREPNLARPFKVPGGMPVAVLLGIGPAIVFATGLWEELRSERTHGMAIGTASVSIVLGAIVWVFRRPSQTASSSPS